MKKKRGAEGEGMLCFSSTTPPGLRVLRTKSRRKDVLRRQKRNLCKTTSAERAASETTTKVAGRAAVGPGEFALALFQINLVLADVGSPIVPGKMAKTVHPASVKLAGVPRRSKLDFVPFSSHLKPLRSMLFFVMINFCIFR